MADGRSGVGAELLHDARLLCRPVGLHLATVRVAELRHRQLLAVVDSVDHDTLLLTLEEALEVLGPHVGAVVVGAAWTSREIQRHRAEGRGVNALLREEPERLRVQPGQVLHVGISRQLAGLAVDLLDIPTEWRQLAVGLDLRLQTARAFEEVVHSPWTSSEFYPAAV
eukprot:scaffold114366_cov36-Phaeocystis_antarctica.AAC.1